MFCPPLSTPPMTARGEACSLTRAIFSMRLLRKSTVLGARFGGGDARRAIPGIAGLEASAALRFGVRECPQAHRAHARVGLVEPFEGAARAHHDAVHAHRTFRI